MIDVLADQNLYQLEYFLPSDVDLQTFDPSGGLPDHWSRFDALLIRTVTGIDERLLDGDNFGRISFIGSGSAGHDHIDRSLLRDQGITFAYAPGCNARAVAEYVVTSLLIWSTGQNLPLEELQVGIVGVGHVGSALSGLLDQLGISYIPYDPPREQRDPDFMSSSIETLQKSDVLSFHTPLTYTGDHPTCHWLNRTRLEKTSYKLIINTARGGVVDEQALLEAHKSNTVEAFILDVWENEPVFRDNSAQYAFIRTPHIAGYSRQAKLRASRMICSQLARHFQFPEPPGIPQKSIHPDKPFHLGESSDLADILHQLHPMNKYQQALDKLIGMPSDKKARFFANIRTGQEYRNEYPYLRIKRNILQQYPILTILGVQPL